MKLLLPLRCTKSIAPIFLNHTPKHQKNIFISLAVVLTSLIVFGGLSPVKAQSCITETTQADFQAGTGNNIDLTSSVGDIVLSNSILDQQNTTLGTSGVGITVTTYGGQTFTPSVSGQLTKISINLFCSGCTGTSPNLTVELRATSSNLPTGAAISTATMNGFKAGNNLYYDAVFSSPPTLISGVKYAFVIHPVTNPSPGTYALTRSGTSTAGADVYSGGTRVSGATSGTVWSIPNTGGITTDVGFKTYITPTTTISGDYTSAAKDAGSLAKWTTLSFTDSLPSNTTIQFQAAASNSISGPFNFIGPDGTSSTYFTTSGASLNNNFNGVRYLKYKAYLSTTNTNFIPVLRDVTLCYTTNNAPTFTISLGKLKVCENSTNVSFDSLLQINDADNSQTETYSVSSPPANGTITAGGSAISNGSTVSPTGWSYAPNSGFFGSDQFTIQVSDGNGGTATKIIKVTIDSVTYSSTTVSVCNSYSWHGNSYVSSGVYVYNYNNSNGCPNADTLHLTINTLTSSTIDSTICFSQLPFVWNTHTFNAAGNYTYHLINAKGCDSAITLSLKVVDLPIIIATTINNSTCSGSAFTVNAKNNNCGVVNGFNGNYDLSNWIIQNDLIHQNITSNITKDTITMIDSINSGFGAYQEGIFYAACDGMVSFRFKYSSTGNINYNVQVTSAGLNNFASTVISSNQPNMDTGSISFPILNHNSVAIRFTVYSSTAIGKFQIFDFKAPKGETLNFNWYDSISGGHHLSNTDSYSATLDSVGDHYFYATATNSIGCVSARAPVKISVLPIPTVHVNVGTACPNNRAILSVNAYPNYYYQWDPNGTIGDTTQLLLGNVGTQNYYDIYVEDVISGCSNTIQDSILSTIHSQLSTVNLPICSSQLPYEYLGKTFTVSHLTDTITYTSLGGCDSIVIYSFQVKQSTSSIASQTICASLLPYSYLGHTMNAPGNDTLHLTNAAHCDSLAILTLIVNIPTQSLINQAICSNQLPYSYLNHTMSGAGNDTLHLTNAVGCDSMAILSLAVTPASSWYRDADGDGYGNAAISQTACVQPTGYVNNNTDCDDSKSAVHAPLQIVQNPVNGFAVTGGSTSFTVTATNVIAYHWLVSTNNGASYNYITNSNKGIYSGYNTATLTLSNVPANYNNRIYRCQLDGCGYKNSYGAKLTIMDAPCGTLAFDSVTNKNNYLYFYWHNSNAYNDTVVINRIGAGTVYLSGGTAYQKKCYYQISPGSSIYYQLKSKCPTNRNILNSVTTRFDNQNATCSVIPVLQSVVPITNNMVQVTFTNSGSNRAYQYVYRMISPVVGPYTTPVKTFTTTGGGTFNIAGLSIGATYEFAIRNNCGAANTSTNNSVISNIITLTMYAPTTKLKAHKTTTDEDVATVALSMSTSTFSLSPNPAENRVKVSYELPKENNSTLLVRLLDLSGKLVRELRLDNPPQIGYVSLDLDEVQTGIYLVNVQTEGYTETKKLVVNK